MITGSPTPDKMNTPIRGKRGDRAKRRLTKYNPYRDVSSERGCPVTTEYKVDRYLTGWQERTFETASGGTVKRMVLTVLDCVTKNPKYNNRTGPRRHHRPQTLRNDSGYYPVPSFATEVISRRERKEKAEKGERKGFTVTIDPVDGCHNVAVRSHLVKYGYTVKNKHTAKAPGVAVPSGEVLSNDPNEWVLKRIILEGPKRQKLKTATCIVRNPNKRIRKSIVLNRVRNEEEARMMLEKIHGIK